MSVRVFAHLVLCMQSIDLICGNQLAKHHSKSSWRQNKCDVLMSVTELINHTITTNMVLLLLVFSNSFFSCLFRYEHVSDWEHMPQMQLYHQTISISYQPPQNPQFCVDTSWKNTDRTPMNEIFSIKTNKQSILVVVVVKIVHF